MDKDYALLVNSVQEANDYAVYALTEGGYDGSALQALVVIKPADARTTAITERMSHKHIELLAKANTHGKNFFMTGGSHVCSDDFFKAQALLAREGEIKEKGKLKKTLMAKVQLQEKGMAILVEKAACFESNNYKDISIKELDTLLQWYDIPKEKMKRKADKVARWRETRANNTAPPVLVGWSTEDEEELMRINVAANVANMLGTCRNDTRFHSNFGQMGRCWRHKIDDVGTFCVGLSRHPSFPPKTRPAQVRM
jgi:hypothetical protein